MNMLTSIQRCQSAASTIVLTAPTISLSDRTSSSITISITSSNTVSGVVYDVYYGTGLFVTTATTSATISGLTYGVNYNIYAYARYGSTILSPQSNTLSNIQTLVNASMVTAPTIAITSRTSTTLTVGITSTNTLPVVFDVYYGAGLYITTSTTTATITTLSPSVKYNIYAYARFDGILSPQSNTLSNIQTYVYATPIQLTDTTYQTNSSTTTDTFTVSGAGFTHANGTYVFSGSSADSTTHRAHRVFNNSASETHVWANSGSGGTNVYGTTYTQMAYGASGYVGGGTGRYYTTTASGTAYAGEWLQVKLPYSFVLKSYEIYNRSGYPARVLKTGAIAGSNDGTNWTLLDLPGFPDNVTINKTFPISNETPFTYYRLIVTANYGGTYINFYSIRLLGQVYVA